MIARLIASANLLAVFIGTLCFGSASLVTVSSVWADKIELKSGNRLEGMVLKTTSDAIYVDIGVDVIKVPLSQIAKRITDEPSEAVDEVKDGGQLFRTAKLPVRPVKDLAERFGEGVVLIQTPGGSGSGFIINDRGQCVTNYHVIEQETKIAVTLFHRSAGGEFIRRRVDDIKILALNPFFDLALLEIPKQEDLDFRPVYLVEENDEKEGDLVFAIGNPLGLERTISQGIVSLRNRSFEGLLYIQTTAQINPGNSGGPLFNSRGEVVGVTNMKLTIGEGIGFAIPVTYVKHFLGNRDAFAFDKTNPNTGHRYLNAPRRRNPAPPKQ